MSKIKPVLEKYYDFETLGVQAPECSCPVSVVSQEDKKTLELFESSYQTIIP